MTLSFRRWLRVVLCGLVAGIVINACEWVAHTSWLDAAWQDAFARLGRSPKGWSSFIPANFWLGVLIVWGYQWLRALYGRKRATMVRAWIAAWLVFWVIPIAALQPLELFPNRLLALTTVIGFVDSLVATALAVWLFERSWWGVTAPSAALVGAPPN